MSRKTLKSSMGHVLEPFSQGDSSLRVCRSVWVSDQLEYLYLKQVKHKPSFHTPPFNSATLILSFLPSLWYFCPRACPEAWPLVWASKWETLFGTLSLVKNNVIKTATTASSFSVGALLIQQTCLDGIITDQLYYPCLLKFAFMHLSLEHC